MSQEWRTEDVMKRTGRWNPGEFCWYELGTTDVAGAKRFYGEMFGWGHEDLSVGGRSYTLWQQQGEAIGGLYKLEGPMFEGVPSHWMTYVAVDSVDESIEKAKSLGGAVFMGPHDVADVGRMAFVRDPQGAAIALYQEAGHPGTARWDRPPPGTIAWPELMTTDMDGAIAFYTGLFGWEAKVSDSGPTRYTEWVVGGGSAGGCLPRPPEAAGVPPHWIDYVTVGDCDAAVRKAQELGGRVVFGPADIPDVGRFATLLDPQGAGISIIKLG
jgi:predicted enzyme related to lactoylglutathione lyase